MQPTRRSSRPPPKKWFTTVFRVLAAGKYAALWVPEFLHLYEQIVREEGEGGAFNWALREIGYSIKPSLALRVYRVLRVVYLGWKAYRKVARD
jgi:hypothetical protein